MDGWIWYDMQNPFQELGIQSNSILFKWKMQACMYCVSTVQYGYDVLYAWWQMYTIYIVCLATPPLILNKTLSQIRTVLTMALCHRVYRLLSSMTPRSMLHHY